VEVTSKGAYKRQEEKTLEESYFLLPLLYKDEGKKISSFFESNRITYVNGITNNENQNLPWQM